MAKQKNTSLDTKNAVVAYGLSRKELESLKANLPSKDTMLFVAKDMDATVVGFDGFAVVANIEGLADKDLETLLWFYEEVPHSPETVVVVGTLNDEVNLNPKFVRYPTFEALEPDLKYLLLGARKRKKGSDNFSNSMANILRTLKLISENPGISSRKIAEELEVAPRSVTRYIETLNIAGESIVYDRKSNGWRLEYGESFLMMGA